MTHPTPLLAQCVEHLRPRIDSALSQYTDLAADCPAELREAMRYSLLAPGKRIRPLLVLLSAQACGGGPETAMPAACAVEMVHTYSLIHDDLPAMDDDDLRRGRPTCHKKFGEALAILAGDALLALGFEVVARHIQPAAVAARCCAELAAAAGPCCLVGGQADDCLGKLRRSDSEDASPESGMVRLESIHQRKTGAMIAVSLRLGALAAGADAARLASLDRFGRCLGLAFQITDDLLDVRGAEAEVGKRLGKDSNRGKLTFPGLLGIDRSVRRAEELIDEGCDALAPLGSQADGLKAVARYVLERNL
ncbi:MAG: polyprenyl synthetase family protein [Rhodopirellula sp.]|nr:polyprenyl synthetase family protein [Rhodopirellula sp.]